MEGGRGGGRRRVRWMTVPSSLPTPFSILSYLFSCSFSVLFLFSIAPYPVPDSVLSLLIIFIFGPCSVISSPWSYPCRVSIHSLVLTAFLLFLPMPLSSFTFCYSGLASSPFPIPCPSPCPLLALSPAPRSSLNDYCLLGYNLKVSSVCGVTPAAS